MFRSYEVILDSNTISSGALSSPVPMSQCVAVMGHAERHRRGPGRGL